MQIIPINEANIEIISEVLRNGGLIIFPSETTYGAAVDATNKQAVNKLILYKQRPAGKPYSVMVSDIAMARKYVEINKTAENIYSKFLPGPMTVVSKGKHAVASGVESENGSLGIRIPDYPFLLKLISVFGKPLTATSANSSYKKRPYCIEDVLENISGRQKSLIDLIIDAGRLPNNEPSTVVDTTMDDAVVLRQGEIMYGDKNSVTTRSEENTRNFGKELWQKYEKYAGSRAMVFALEGPMGAGKTQFTKGLAKAMEVNEEVVSPTFNLEIEYETKNKGLKLIHFDAWRMQTGQELEELGYQGFLNDKSVLAIEWADRVAEIIRKYNDEAVVIWVKIEYGKSDNERVITWHGK